MKNPFFKKIRNLKSTIIAADKGTALTFTSASNLSGNQGEWNNAPAIGEDVWAYFHTGITERKIAFGGSVHISGNLTVDGIYPSDGGGGGSLLTQKTVFAGSTTVDVTASSPEIVSIFEYNPSDFTASAHYFTFIASVVAETTGTLQVYNLTSGSLLVISGTSTEIDVTSAAPTRFSSVDLLTMGNVSAGSALYEIRAYCSGTTADLAFTIYNAEVTD